MLLNILRDSGPRVGALALFFGVLNIRGLLVLSLSFPLARWAAGGASFLSAAGTGQHQLAAELGAAKLILVPWKAAIPAI